MGKQLDRMLDGKLYCCLYRDSEREKKSLKKVEFLDKFNSTSFGDYQTRENLVKDIFEHVGKDCCINKPFYCDYGCNISVGDNFYANFDCIFLDVNKIKIGNNVFLAPRVCIYTAGHPIDNDVRNLQLEYGYPVTIGNDVWIGGNTVINPGIKIGNNVVIGSNSVVTHDIPDNVIAAGNPCKVIRPIQDKDRLYWEKQKNEFFEDCGD